jgi:hypothetical protein
MLNGEVSAVQLGYSIQSDLDSHATIIVLVPIVHAAITYNCPYTHKSWLLIVKNAQI